MGFTDGFSNNLFLFLEEIYMNINKQYHVKKSYFSKYKFQLFVKFYCFNQRISIADYDADKHLYTRIPWIRGIVQYSPLSSAHDPPSFKSNETLNTMI